MAEQDLFSSGVGVGMRTRPDAAIGFALKQFQLFESDLQLPAKVISFDRAKNTATVQPLIAWTGLDGTIKPRNAFMNIPVLSLGGGKFHVSFPLAPGDIGWIKASDRDLSLFMQTLKESKAGSDRSHDFGDGLFVPDVFRNYTVAGEDAGAMVIQSTDGQTKISIRGDNILIATKTLNVRADDANFSGNVTITGQTAANGGFTSKEGTACTLPSSTTVNNKKVDTHVHDKGSYTTQSGGAVIGGTSGQF
ncbi:Gp138 family membrane-puncturing spike protein [Burkholderia contaminans]|uniref:Gp138 family membrane-puncturing spike protein n=1 Tax=Burkholderia contaminans TaxID=488447 RepID=UPI003D66D0AF